MKYCNLQINKFGAQKHWAKKPPLLFVAVLLMPLSLNALVFAPAETKAGSLHKPLAFCLNGASGDITKDASLKSPDQAIALWKHWAQSHGYLFEAQTSLSPEIRALLTILSQDRQNVQSAKLSSPHESKILICFSEKFKPGSTLLWLHLKAKAAPAMLQDPADFPLPPVRTRSSCLLVKAGRQIPGLYEYHCPWQENFLRDWFSQQLHGRGFHVENRGWAEDHNTEIWSLRLGAHTAVLSMANENTGGSHFSILTDLRPAIPLTWPQTSPD